MTTTQEALEQARNALESLEKALPAYGIILEKDSFIAKAITSIDEALASESEQEPVAIKDRAKRIADLFMSEPVPYDVQSDLCATMPNYLHRTGTNLMHYNAAVKMFEGILEKMSFEDRAGECDECGVKANEGHALYCVTCMDKVYEK